MCRNNMDEKKKQVQAKTGKIDAYFFHADDQHNQHKHGAHLMHEIGLKLKRLYAGNCHGKGDDPKRNIMF